MTTFEINYTRALEDVNAGTRNRGCLFDMIRQRIRRIDEILRPLPGYAPAACEPAMRRERDELVARLAALRAA